MKKIVKYLALVFIVLLVVAIVIYGRTKIQNKHEDSTTPTVLPDLQKTHAKYTRDFDISTNQTVIFDDISFQIPGGWTTNLTEEGILQIIGNCESQLGPMQLEVLGVDVTENELASLRCQKAIEDTYFEMMKEMFEKVEITNSSYHSQDGLLYLNIEASFENTPVELGVCAFVTQRKLYAYVVPFMLGDEYDYSLDVQEVVYTVTPGGHVNGTLSDYGITPEKEMEEATTDAQVPEREIDIEVTEKTKNMFRFNYNETSWYSDVIDIVAYTDGLCKVTVIEKHKENGQFYGSAVWACGNDYGLHTVMVVDVYGTVLFVFEH